MNDPAMTDRKLRMAMIGGGYASVDHRKGAGLDGEIELVAGTFSRDPDRAARIGKSLCLDPERVYGDWREMLRREAARPAGERVDMVSIAAPNLLHFEQARAALEAGFHVVLDKPATLNVEEAGILCELVKKSGKVFALAHTCVGYAMIKLARNVIRSGRPGATGKGKAFAECLSGFLADGDPAPAGSRCQGADAIHAYDDKAGMEWRRVNCDRLKIRHPNRSMEVWSRGRDFMRIAAVARSSRPPTWRQEGGLEAFDGLCLSAASAIRRVEAGARADQVGQDRPGVEEGLRGMLFVAAIIESSRNRGQWAKLMN